MSFSPDQEQPASTRSAVSELLRSVFRPGLPRAVAEDFAEEVARINQRRLRVLLPLISVGHAIHVAVFWPSAAARAALAARVLEWREGVAEVHAATLVAALSLMVHAFGRKTDRPSRVLGPATAAAYLVHAAVVVGVDQLTLTSVTPFIGYCLGIAGVLVIAPTTTLFVYALGLAVYVAGIRVSATTVPSGGARAKPVRLGAVYPSDGYTKFESSFD